MEKLRPDLFRASRPYSLPSRQNRLRIAVREALHDSFPCFSLVSVPDPRRNGDRQVWASVTPRRGANKKSRPDANRDVRTEGVVFGSLGEPGPGTHGPRSVCLRYKAPSRQIAVRVRVSHARSANFSTFRLCPFLNLAETIQPAEKGTFGRQRVRFAASTQRRIRIASGRSSGTILPGFPFGISGFPVRLIGNEQENVSDTSSRTIFRARPEPDSARGLVSLNSKLGAGERHEVYHFFRIVGVDLWPCRFRASGGTPGQGIRKRVGRRCPPRSSAHRAASSVRSAASADRPAASTRERRRRATGFLLRNGTLGR